MPFKILPWHKIGHPEGRAGTLPELQDYYGDAWPYLTKYFFPTQRFVSSISCSKPGGDACPMRVVVHSHNDIVAVCGNTPKECDPVTLTRRDVVIHELKTRALLSELAIFLHVKGTNPENLLPLTWNLGIYSLPNHSAMNVYVSLQSDSNGLQSIAIQLIVQKEKPFILLVPSRNFCPVSLLETIHKTGTHLIGLDELQCRQRIMGYEDLLGEFVFAELAEKGPGKENFFRFEKDYWQIRFQGKPCSIKQSVGMQYIVHLILRSCNDEPPIYVTDLYYLVKGSPVAQDTELNRLTKEELEEMGLDVASLGNAGDIMTPEGKERTKNQLQEYAQRIEESESYGNVDESLRLRAIKEDLEDYIRKAHGSFGRTRKASDANEKIRKTVTRSIERALEKMGKKDGDELAVYLDDHLEKGFFCSFREDKNINWQIFM